MPGPGVSSHLSLPLLLISFCSRSIALWPLISICHNQPTTLVTQRTAERRVPGIQHLVFTFVNTSTIDSLFSSWYNSSHSQHLVYAHELHTHNPNTVCSHCPVGNHCSCSWTAMRHGPRQHNADDPTQATLGIIFSFQLW